MNKLTTWLQSLAENHTPNFAECVDYLGQYFTLLHQFEHTEQDSEWHAEGNVAIHTEMVLQALYTLLESEAKHIRGVARQSLILAALLHDIAKPLTTRRKEIAGRIRVVAPKHEQIGTSYLATRLISLPLVQQSVLTIMGLVGFHQMPKLLVLKNSDFKDYFKLSLNVDLALLYWLEIADMKGRVCPDLSVQLDFLEQFRLFAEEYQLWQVGTPALAHLAQIQVKKNTAEQVFLNGYATTQLASGDISTAEEAIAKHYQACQQYSHLYVMCGISGSGKSTWIEQNLSNFDVISLDEIRREINGKRLSQKNRGQVLQQAKTRLKQALAQKRNVVWDATNIRKDFRKIICDLGISYNALITMVVFQQSEKALRTNNRHRKFAVSDEVITDQVNKLEWPWFSEAHRLLIIGEKGKELYRYGSFE